LARARGDLLVLTDDDVMPATGWLAAFTAALQQTGADYAVGRIHPLWEAQPPAWMSPELYGVLAVPVGGSRRLTISNGVNDHVMPLGANMAVRRHVLTRIGGWNPDLGKLQGTLRTGEDHEFALRMLKAGFVGVYEPTAVVHHRVTADRLRLSYFRQWFFDNGGIEARLEHDYPTATHYWLDAPRYLWRRLWSDVRTIGVALLTLNVKRATAAALRIIWFAGYLRGRWTAGRRAGAVPAPRVVVPRS
jgi:GT2 family glycosyltransferase